MLKKAALFLGLAICWSSLFAQDQIKGSDFTFSLDGGRIVSISDLHTGQEYVREAADLLTVDVHGVRLPALSMHVEGSKIRLDFPQNIQVTVGYLNKGAYLTFEVLDLKPAHLVTAVIWNVNTIIGETIGECIGVVRNKDFAIGIQALNTKTTGGIYQNDDGFTAERGNTAVKTALGSRLEAFSIDRSIDRSLNVWNEWAVRFPQMPVPAMAGETVVGSKIALFACPANKVLDRIGQIERGEGLPHPVAKDGKWLKQDLRVRIPYMITNFSEENVDELLLWTVAGGFSGIYQEHPFDTWGHFKLSPKLFPSDRAGLKQCVDKATVLGLRTGVHTLSTFITPNDPYVTPVPDKRLAVTGASVLTADVGLSDTEVLVEDTLYFSPKQNNTLKTVRIGEELIQYGAVSTFPPFKLLQCTRGAFGSKATVHVRGAQVSKLLDYPYEVFFPNWELQKEMAKNLTTFLNETGVNHIDFDGHEGCYATGQGEHAMDQYVLDVLDGVKYPVFNGSSRAKHFYWHSASYLNWGEPWYGGFRESQNDYRIQNQAYYERNYLPNMLGWFLLTPHTSVDDINWMMARAAGYNAGFAFVARLEAIRKNPDSKELFALLKLWNEAIQKQIFTPEQRVALKNVNNEFHLEKSDGKYLLYPFVKHEFEHLSKRLQPGEPVFSTFNFDNMEREQAFKMTVYISGEEGSSINGLTMSLDGQSIIRLNHPWPAGTTLLFTRQKVKVYNHKGALVSEKELLSLPVNLNSGKHTLKADAGFSGEGMKLKISLKTEGKPMNETVLAGGKAQPAMFAQSVALSEACARKGVAMGVYFSLID